MIKRINPVIFFFFLKVLFIFSSQTFAEEKEIKNPLKAGLVRIGSSYKNQCVQKKEKCNEYIKRVGLGFIFKINLNKPHYFVATTSHLTQGSDLFITNLNNKIKYTIKNYKIGTETQNLRSINNDEDLEIIEIEDPHLGYYFEHTPSKINQRIAKTASVVRTTSNAICTRIDKIIARNHMEQPTPLTSELIGLNLDEEYKQLIPFLKLALDEQDSNGYAPEWTYPLNFVQSGILTTQSVFYIFDLKKTSPEDKNNAFTNPNHFMVDFVQDMMNGYQQIDSSVGLSRTPEFSWNLNDMFLNHFIFRGQSGTPFFYQRKNNELCFNGLIKGFHRYFRKAYTNDIDGSDIISKTIAKLKLLDKSSRTELNLKLTETFGQSYWFMKDEETYRRFQVPFIKGEISELASWYGPSGGSDTSDGGGSDSSDGGGDSKQISGQDPYFDLKATRPLADILSSSNSPGVNVGEEIILGIDIDINSKKRNLYANMNSFNLLNTHGKQLKANYIKLKDFEDTKFLFNRISERLSNLTEYFEQLKRYQMVVVDEVFARKSLLVKGMHLLYSKIYENQKKLNPEDVNALDSEEINSLQKIASSFLNTSQIIDQLKPEVFNFLNTKPGSPHAYCQVKIINKTLELKVYKGLGLKVDLKNNTMVDLTSDDVATNFLKINLNPQFQVISISSEEGIYQSLSPKVAHGLDLRPKFFIKKGLEKTYENLFIIDIKGLLFLDLSRARIQLTANESFLNTYKTVKKRLPVLTEEPFDETIDKQKELFQYSPEASILSRVAHITYKPVGSFKEHMIPCHPMK